jgi:DNA replication and repair protein RecF
VYLNNIKITNFRNYEKLEINFSKNINIFVGDNALGKTNIIESIYVLALSKSFRPVTDNNLIKLNKSSYQLLGNVQKKDFNDELKINYNNHVKMYYLNSKKSTKLTDYLSNMNVIIFSPDDLEIIKGAPDIRRKYLNMEIMQLNSLYSKVLNDYNSLLKMRNDYLKKIKSNIRIDEVYLSILEEHLINRAIYIYKIRNKFLKKISKISKNIYKSTMEKDGFNIKYLTTPHIDNFSDEEITLRLKESFLNNRDKEISYGSTLYGPHKDDFNFMLGDENLKLIGSQSQQKLSVLVFKLAEIELFYMQTDEYPILLLDDIFSELDDKRKNNVLSYLREDIQTFITTTDINNINNDIVKNAKIFKISNCEITEL